MIPKKHLIIPSIATDIIMFLILLITIIIKIDNNIAIEFAIGIASHLIYTAKAMESNEIQRVMVFFVIRVNEIITVILVSFVLRVVK